MLYPLYVHKDEGSAYGGTFPDIPGCFTAADDLADLPRAAQEAVEVHFDGEDAALPAATAPEQWTKSKDYRGGFWLMVEIDTSRVGGKAMRLNVSLPTNLVQRIDRHTEQRGLTRSGFLAAAAHEALMRSNADTVVSKGR